MERINQICEAGQKYLDSMDEFQRYHTYPREAFIDGAKWADENPKNGMVSIEKACEWLRRNYTNYMINDLSKYVENVCWFDIFDDLLVDDFREAMEE